MTHHAPSTLTLTLTLLAACGDDSDAADTAADTVDTVAEDSTSRGDDNATSPASTDSPDSTDSTDPSDSTTASPADESSGGDDPFAGCNRETLEADFGPPLWVGPGADPKTGALIDDGETTYFVSVTYLALQADAFPAFAELNPALNEALFSNPGLVATQLGASLSCNSARTFTVWTDQAAMMAFVGSDAHLAAIGAFPSLSRGSSTLSVWDDLVPAAEITWDEALSRIAAEEAYD